MCGSFGLGAEGRLLACAQCGQCYHPFCVGLKVCVFPLSTSTHFPVHCKSKNLHINV